MKKLSKDAAELLREILADHSIHRGVSFMSLSQTRGVYTPYFWDTSEHGPFCAPTLDIAAKRAAAEELAEKGYLLSPPDLGGQLIRYALNTEWETGGTL